MVSSRLLIEKAGYLEKDTGSLIAEAKSGSTCAFEEIYRTHVGRVHALCLRILADRAQAEEVVQQIFVRVWIKLGTFRGEAGFSSWLYRLAINVIISELNCSRRDRNCRPESAAFFSGSRVESAADLRLDLEKAISFLPGQARAVFVLHDIEGWKHEEIARAMGLAVGTCKAQLSRARRILREVLGT